MDEEGKRRIADALGAKHVEDLEGGRVGGPLDLLALRAQVSQRLRSTGGRPTDPDWTVSRQVPFKDVSWSRLQKLATEVGRLGRRVGPAQVAALLIESSLEELQQSDWESVLKRTRAMPLVTQPDAAEAAQVTYNQFDDWVQRGWLVPTSRKGHERLYSTDEIIRAIWLRLLAQHVADVEQLSEEVRRLDLSARYLVATDGSVLHPVATRARLYQLLETAGSHLVMDQLAERRQVFHIDDDGGDNGAESFPRAV